MTDLYHVLGVTKDATAEDINDAYRLLAKKYHPDRNVGDEFAAARYAEVDEAYSILSDPERRSRYDTNGDCRRPNTEEQDLLGVIAPVLFQAIQETEQYTNGGVKTSDLKTKMVNKITGTLRRIEEHRGKINAGIHTLEIVLGRFEKEGQSDDMLNGVVQSQLTQLKTQLEQVKFDLNRHDRALKYLSGVEYRRDKTKREPTAVSVPKLDPVLMKALGSMITNPFREDVE